MEIRIMDKENRIPRFPMRSRYIKGRKTHAEFTTGAGAGGSTSCKSVKSEQVIGNGNPIKIPEIDHSTTTQIGFTELFELSEEQFGPQMLAKQSELETSEKNAPPNSDHSLTLSPKNLPEPFPVGELIFCSKPFRPATIAEVLECKLGGRPDNKTYVYYLEDVGTGEKHHARHEYIGPFNPEFLTDEEKGLGQFDVQPLPKYVTRTHKPKPNQDLSTVKPAWASSTRKTKLRKGRPKMFKLQLKPQKSNSLSSTKAFHMMKKRTARLTKLKPNTNSTTKVAVSDPEPHQSSSVAPQALDISTPRMNKRKGIPRKLLPKTIVAVSDPKPNHSSSVSPSGLVAKSGPDANSTTKVAVSDPKPNDSSSVAPSGLETKLGPDANFTTKDAVFDLDPNHSSSVAPSGLETKLGPDANSTTKVAVSDLEPHQSSSVAPQAFGISTTMMKKRKGRPKKLIPETNVGVCDPELRQSSSVAPQALEISTPMMKKCKGRPRKLMPETNVPVSDPKPSQCSTVAHSAFETSTYVPNPRKRKHKAKVMNAEVEIIFILPANHSSLDAEVSKKRKRKPKTPVFINPIFSKDSYASQTTFASSTHKSKTTSTNDGTQEKIQKALDAAIHDHGHYCVPRSIWS